MHTVLIAGATGYLGRHLVGEYLGRGWQVRALVRDIARARTLGLDGAKLIEAEATQPGSLAGAFDGAELVVSSLGLTRQTDGLTPRAVDYQANVNILEAAIRAGVGRFGYVHVLGADRMRDVPLVAAKQAFVERLWAAPVEASVIAPSGYFSDMDDFLGMARRGRIWLFGDGTNRMNPIHGADLAVATADAVAEGRGRLDIGGPDVLTQTQLATLAFNALGQPARITHLPDILRRAALGLLPWTTPRRIHGPAQFFLSAMGLDMVGTPHGSRHLADHFATLAGATPRRPT